MKFVLSTVALVGLAQATSLTSQAEIKAEATYYTYSGCPETIFPPGTTSPPEEEHVLMQAQAAYECQ